VAAIDQNHRSGAGSAFGCIVLAACALPGVLAGGSAWAEEAPERGVIGFSLSSYREQQDGGSASATTSSSTTSAKAASASTKIGRAHV
jgi:hypothetical protein